MNVRHAYRRSQIVNTVFGNVELDHNGMVTNLDELLGSPEQLIQLPNYVNADLFPPPIPMTSALPVVDDTPAPEEEDTEETDPHEQTYRDLIEQLLADGAPVTGEGYIDMAVLNEALHQKGVPLLIGERRKVLQDAVTSLPEVSSDEGGESSGDILNSELSLTPEEEARVGAALTIADEQESEADGKEETLVEP